MKGSSANRAPVHNEDVIWRRIEDNVVLIEKDGRSMHVLNKTAARIWELCDGENGVDEIADELYERFDPAGIDITADVRDTILRMADMGLLKELEDLPHISGD
jgi:transcriptional regulator